MIVTCPNCETKFEIPDDKYRPGRKARCSNCGHVFLLPERDAAFEAVPDPVDRGGTGPTPAAQASAASGTEAIFGIAGMEADAGASFADDVPRGEDTAPPASFEDVVLPEPDAPPRKKRNKKFLALILGVIFAVALLGYGGIMVYSAFFAHPAPSDPTRLTDGTVVDSLGGRTEQADPEKEAARRAAVRLLALEGVRQYTVTDNDNTGPMVVVEGRIVNNFDTPKDLILLEITLFDRQGNALVLREQYGGITLTPLQLRTLSKAAIESALADQTNIILNNTDIPPGGSVPFTTVFFDLPKGAYEFEVKIVDVQDPASHK